MPTSLKQKQRARLRRMLAEAGLAPIEPIVAVALRWQEQCALERSSGGGEAWQHPALRAVKAVSGLSVPPGARQIVKHALGSQPDLAKLEACYSEWLTRGYNPCALVWALDWYVNGIPTRGGEARADHHPSRPSSETPELTLKEMGYA